MGVHGEMILVVECHKRLGSSYCVKGTRPYTESTQYDPKEFTGLRGNRHINF